jgi:hypothetical protein
MVYTKETKKTKNLVLRPPLMGMHPALVQCRVSRGGRIGKDAPRQFSAAQGAIRGHHLGTKGLTHLLERGPARLDDRAGQVICVHHGHPAGAGE